MMQKSEDRMDRGALTILFATGNKGKLIEAKEVAKKYKHSVIGLEEIRNLRGLSAPPEVEETGETYEENSKIKAEAYFEWAGEFPTLADDSGLEVQSLNGEPGVNTARYAGENATSADNIEKLLKNLKLHENRKAKFVCCLHLHMPDGKEFLSRKEFLGSITEKPSGRGGFGYDPIIIPAGFDLTLSELKEKGEDVKTHRVLALEDIFKQLNIKR